MSDGQTILLIFVVIPALVLGGAFLYGYMKARYLTQPLLQINQPVIHGKASNPKIFVSYRRSDSADVTGRIYDRLVDTFGRGSVFKDVDSIPLGTAFRKHLQIAVQQADIFVGVIGKRWLTETSETGMRRIDDPNDYVRVEFAAALKRGIPVVPVLVSGAEMPAETKLPPALSKVAFQNAISIRHDPDFHTDMDRLIRGVRRVYGEVST